VVLFVMRPGSTKTYRDVADIPFRHEDKPAAAGDKPARARDAKEA
jgi:cytochrome c oxidase cbb3-type subunit 4